MSNPLGPVVGLLDSWNQLRQAKARVDAGKLLVDQECIRQEAEGFADEFIQSICRVVLAIFAGAALYGASYLGASAVVVTGVLSAAISLPATGTAAGLLLIHYGRKHLIKNSFRDTVVGNELRIDLVARGERHKVYLAYAVGLFSCTLLTKLPVGFAETRLIPSLINRCKPFILSYYRIDKL